MGSAPVCQRKLCCGKRAALPVYNKHKEKKNTICCNNGVRLAVMSLSKKCLCLWTIGLIAAPSPFYNNIKINESWIMCEYAHLSESRKKGFPDRIWALYSLFSSICFNLENEPRYLCSQLHCRLPVLESVKHVEKIGLNCFVDILQLAVSCHMLRYMLRRIMVYTRIHHSTRRMSVREICHWWYR